MSGAQSKPGGDRLIPHGPMDREAWGRALAAVAEFSPEMAAQMAFFRARTGDFAHLLAPSAVRAPSSESEFGHLLAGPGARRRIR